jgi:mannonate dehydratase
MYLGSQVPYDRELLTFLRQMGATHVDVTPGPGMGLEDAGHWRVEPLLALREEVEALGLTLAAMHLPLSSAGIERQCWPQIMLGGPERDRQIEQVQRTIAAAGRAGISLLLYNLAILPVVRTAYRPPGAAGQPTATLITSSCLPIRPTLTRR